MIGDYEGITRGKVGHMTQIFRPTTEGSGRKSGGKRRQEAAAAQGRQHRRQGGRQN